MRQWLAALLSTGAVLPVCASDFAVRIGLWRVEVAASQGWAMVTYHTCVRTQRPREAFKFLPNIVNPELQCQQVEFTVQPGVVRWQARCEAPVKVEAFVEIDYREEQLIGVTRVFVEQGGQEAQTVQLIRAKRVGPCE